MQLPQVGSFSLSHIIPTGTQVEVTNSSGVRSSVVGPAKVLRFGNTLRPYTQVILKDHESGTLFNETGKEEEVKGPMVVHVHPDGTFVPHKLISLLPHEAVVIVDKDGNPTIYVGTGFPDAKLDDNAKPPIKKAAQVEVKPLNRIHEFKWTGSKGDTEFKSPGTLRFTNARLQETQTWFAVEARTKDGVMMRLHLMLFLTFTDVSSLLKNDDPMGVVYNSVNAAILKVMGETNFDNFRANPAEKVENAAKLADEGNESAKALKDIGLEIVKATLRLWVPTDPTVERLMAQQASATAQQAVDDAQHTARLRKLNNELDALNKERTLDNSHQAKAESEGSARAAGIKAFASALRLDDAYKDNPDAIRQLVALTETARAATGELTITSEAINKAG